MSFTVQNLADMAQRKIDDTILSSTPTTDEQNFVYDAINDFIDEISDVMPNIATSANIVATALTWAALPTDFIRLYMYADDQYDERPKMTLAGVDYTGDYYIRVHGNVHQIMFPAAGTYTVDYEKVSTRVDALADTVDLHPFICPVGADYLAWQKIKSINATAQNEDYIISERKLEQEYIDRKNKRLKRLLKPDSAPPQVTLYWE